MMINLQIKPAFRNLAPPDLLKSTAGFALQYLGAPANVELTIVADDDDQLQTLNRSFLGVDAPTDVLSFPADELDPDSGNRYIGDIILSIPRAQTQAQVSGHPLEAEISLLVVHGVLHLLGHDHVEPDERAVMWQQQKEILANLGIRLARWPED